MTNPPGSNRLISLRLIRKSIENLLSLEELRIVCYDLGIDYENLSGEGKNTKAQELVTTCHRRGNLAALVERCSDMNPAFPSIEELTEQFNHFGKFENDSKPVEKLWSEYTQYILQPRVDVYFANRILDNIKAIDPDSADRVSWERMRLERFDGLHPAMSSPTKPMPSLHKKTTSRAAYRIIFLIIVVIIVVGIIVSLR